MSRAQRVLHVASHQTNVGDGAVNTVIAERVHALADRPVEIVRADVVVDRTMLSASDVDGFDLVLVGGGGAISAGASNDGCGLALPMTNAELERSSTRFAFVALGHNAFEGESLRDASRLARTLRWAADRGHRFSVRNDGSLGRLRRDVGPAADAVVEVPDPGFFISSTPAVPVESGRDDYVVLQVAGDSIGRRFPSVVPERILARTDGSGLERVLHRRLDALLGSLERYARWLVDEYDVDVLITPHVPADVVLTAALVRRLSTGVNKQRYRRRPFRLVGLPHPRRAREHFGTTASARLVVGMRGHAVTCSLGLGRPTIALSTHPKVAGVMRWCGLSDRTVVPGPDLFGALTASTPAALEDGDRLADLDGRLDRCRADQLDVLLRESLGDRPASSRVTAG